MLGGMFKFTVEAMSVALSIAILGGSAWLYSRYSEPGWCYEDGDVAADPLCTKSIADLMANPEKYDGRVVSIVGEFGFPFEGSYIKDLTYDGALWLHATDEIYSEYRGTCKSVGHLKGTFRKGPSGHLGMSPAVFYATEILDRDTQFREKCGL